MQIPEGLLSKWVDMIPAWRTSGIDVRTKSLKRAIQGSND